MGRAGQHVDTNTITDRLADLASPDPSQRKAGRDGLIVLVIEHMRSVAHRMMRGFPHVHRWDQTDDIVQGASLRLARALDGMVPCGPRHTLRLVAMQVRRELLDLARRYAGPESFASHHETNAAGLEGLERFHTDDAVDPHPASDAQDTSWTRFHEAAESLDDDSRELFHLVWYLGLSQQQAAGVLGCSVRTVARRWDGLKRQLVERLGGQAPT